MRHSLRAETVMAACDLCPRRCGSDRRRTLGFCRAADRTQVDGFGPHHGEEPPISGSRGSGVVFFSRCTMRCLYCQNYPWSQQGRGQTVGLPELEGLLMDLHRRGCHNWNLVSPTPWLPDIVAALEELRGRGLKLPVVYNTSGYEAADTLTALNDWVDVYLTDLRYADPATAAFASQAPDYVPVARQALKQMWRLKGPLQCDQEGIASRGVICRILVLPGHADEAVDSLRWLARTVGTEIAVSLMAQYTPAWRAAECPGWDRALALNEYRPVTETLEELGFVNGWVQELDAPTQPGLIGYNMPGMMPTVLAAG